MTTFKAGDRVTWISSNTYKVGEVVAVVPPGSTPAKEGHPKAGGGSMSRDHETYVVRAQKCGYLGGSYRNRGPSGRFALYWPHVSLLKAASPADA